MQKTDVEQISAQFGLTPEIIEASEKDGTLGTRIKDALSSKVIYDKSEFETFTKNLTTQANTTYFNELVEKAKKGDLPQDLYTPVKGAAYQQKEREWSQKYGIEEYKGIDDLIDKAVKKSSANGKPTDADKVIEDLKNANLKLQQEKENAINSVKDEYKGMFLSKEKKTLLDAVPFDFTGVKADELANKKQKVSNLLESVFDREYKIDVDSQNRIVVLKGTDVLKNPATLEPLNVKDVMISLAKEYNLPLRSPDNGGQGGNSSSSSSSGFSNAQEFAEYCKANNLDPYGKQALELWRKSGLK